MDEIELDEVEETLFVPLRGRIFASKNFKDILYDSKALELEKKVNPKYLDYSNESEYTLLASATRSMNMDLKIREFLKKNPNATIINIGAGLETTFYRCDNKKATWYELDLEEVTSIRKRIMEAADNDIIISYSMFDYEWINYIKNNSNPPYMIIASGVFYYFKMDDILDFLNNLYKLGDVEVVFDCVSKTGIKFTNKYMKQLGKEDAAMYFYVDNPDELTNKINHAQLIESMDYYSKIPTKKKMKFMTKMSMRIGDLFHMVRIIHLKINK